jgi:hypothetical protein
MDRLERIEKQIALLSAMTIPIVNAHIRLIQSGIKSGIIAPDDILSRTRFCVELENLVKELTKLQRPTATPSS